MSDFADALATQVPRLRRYASALTHDRAWADDLVQDTLERALRRPWMFRLNSNMTAWLFTILYRLYLNGTSRRRAMAGEAELAEQAVSPDLPLEIDIRRALERLTPEHRAVIVLVGLEQLSYKEAAEILGIPLGTLMSRLARAREQMRIFLTGQSGPARGASHSPHLKRIK